MIVEILYKSEHWGQLRYIIQNKVYRKYEIFYVQFVSTKHIWPSFSNVMGDLNKNFITKLY